MFGWYITLASQDALHLSFLKRPRNPGIAYLSRWRGYLAPLGRPWASQARRGGLGGLGSASWMWRILVSAPAAIAARHLCLWKAFIPITKSLQTTGPSSVSPSLFLLSHLSPHFLSLPSPHSSSLHLLTIRNFPIVMLHVKGAPVARSPSSPRFLFSIKSPTL